MYICIYINIYIYRRANGIYIQKSCSIWTVCPCLNIFSFFTVLWSTCLIDYLCIQENKVNFWSSDLIQRMSFCIFLSKIYLISKLSLYSWCYDQYVYSGESVSLECRFNLENESLYSVKLYKGSKAGISNNMIAHKISRDFP